MHTLISHMNTLSHHEFNLVKLRARLINCNRHRNVIDIPMT